MLVDLDVEEPNADLFLEKRLEQNHTVKRMIPLSIIHFVPSVEFVQPTALLMPW